MFLKCAPKTTSQSKPFWGRKSRGLGNMGFSFFLFFKDFIYLFLERGEGRERGRETSMCGCPSHAPPGDLACNPGLCPAWEPGTLWFAGQHSIHWATPARAGFNFYWPLQHSQSTLAHERPWKSCRKGLPPRYLTAFGEILLRALPLLSG